MSNSRQERITANQDCAPEDAMKIERILPLPMRIPFAARLAAFEQMKHALTSTLTVAYDI